MKFNQLAVCILITFYACIPPQSRYYTPFGMIEPSDKIKKGRLAVITPVYSTVGIMAAEILSEKLAAEKIFRVIDHNEISKKIPTYPGDMFQATNRTKDENEIDPRQLSPESVAQLQKFNQVLGVDYILLLWVYKTEMRQGLIHSRAYIEIGAKLVSMPSCRVIGYSEFSHSNFVMFHSANEAFRSLCDEALNELITQIKNHIQ